MLIMPTIGDESRVRELKHQLTILQYSQALKALNFAIEEMRVEKGYKRQGTGVHYYYHIVDVMQLLLNFGIRDEIAITAAGLHDGPEDIPWYNLEIVKREYGSDVTEVVRLVTKDPNIDYKKNPEELLKYLNAIKLNWRAALVKTADRMHNFSTLKGCAPEKKLRYALETEAAFIPFFKECRKLYPEHIAFYIGAKNYIQPHLDEIKEHHETWLKLQAAEARIKEFEQHIV